MVGRFRGGEGLERAEDLERGEWGMGGDSSACRVQDVQDAVLLDIAATKKVLQVISSGWMSCEC